MIAGDLFHRYRRRTGDPREVLAVQWGPELSSVDAYTINCQLVEWAYPWLLGDALRPEKLRAVDGSSSRGIWIEPDAGRLVIRNPGPGWDRVVEPGEWILRREDCSVWARTDSAFRLLYMPV